MNNKLYSEYSDGVDEDLKNNIDDIIPSISLQSIYMNNHGRMYIVQNLYSKKL